MGAIQPHSHPWEGSRPCPNGFLGIARGGERRFSNKVVARFCRGLTGRAERRNLLMQRPLKMKTTFPLNKPLGRYGLYNHC